MVSKLIMENYSTAICVEISFSRGVDDSHNEDQNIPVRVAVPYVTDSGQLCDVTLSEYHIGVWRDYCYICPACVVERQI